MVCVCLCLWLCLCLCLCLYVGGGLLLDLTTTWLKIETMEASLLLTTALMSIAMPLCFLASAASNANSFLIYMSIGQVSRPKPQAINPKSSKLQPSTQDNRP